MKRCVNNNLREAAKRGEIKIAVHQGVFHADDVTAVALLKSFLVELLGEKVKVVIERVTHQQKDFKEFDLVLDVGGKYDGVKYFDHHQWTKEENLHAAAGLVWEAIKKALSLGEEYSSLEELIEIIDAADIGVRPAQKWEYPNLISRFNASDIYSEIQEQQFLKAVAFAEEIIKNLKEGAKEIKKAKAIAKNIKNLENEGLPEVVELPEFSRLWNQFINGRKTPGIEAVIWFDKNQNCYKAQVVPVAPGSFQRVGKGFKPDTTGKMSFVHPGEFFCVAPDRTTLINYLKKHFK